MSDSDLVTLLPSSSQAFIDFEDKDCAIIALERLQGFKLTSTHTLHLNYAK